MNSTQAVLKRATPPRRQALPGIIFGVLADLCVVGLLVLSMWLITRSAEQPPILHLTFAIVGVRAFAIGRAAFRYVERLASHDAALRQLAVLRAGTFEALVPHVPGAIEQHRRGDVLAAFVDDVDQLQDEPLRVRQPLIVSSIVVLLSLGTLTIVSPVGALVLTVSLVVFGALAVWLSQRISAESDRALSEARAALTDALLERFSAAEVLAAFGAQPRQRTRIAEAEARCTRIQLDRSRAAGVTGALLSFGSGLASLIILLLLQGALGTSLSAPLFAAAVIMPAAVFEIFAQAPAALAARRTVLASAGRVAALTEGELPPEIPVDSIDVLFGGGARANGIAGGDRGARLPAARSAAGSATRAPLIEVRALAARHPGAEHPAFDGISFTLHAGETLVITGESGAGKSTLALALVRLLDYTGSYRLQRVSAPHPTSGRPAGEIVGSGASHVARGAVHGAAEGAVGSAAGTPDTEHQAPVDTAEFGLVEARTLSGAEVRRAVGLCEQQPHLFDADLRQNLKFARDTASDVELLAALDRVGLGQWALERGGLDAPVGERGALVSGGQAQRIALARALLADFPVVILDEPTAGVDRELADRLLLDLLAAVPENRAVILITHTELPAGLPASRLEL